MLLYDESLHMLCTTTGKLASNTSIPTYLGSRDGAVVRGLASHQYDPGLTPGPGIICGFSLSLLQEVFLRVLRFSPLLKNQHIQIPIRSWKQPQ